MPSNTLLNKLAQAIRRRREALSVSQEAFADLIHMHRTYYSAIERGERNVTVQTLGKVASGLRVTLSELFAEAGD